MSKLTRDLYEPFIDLDRGKGAAEGKYRWGRVRKSTIFEFSANAQEETYGYIDTKTDTTEVTSYQPQLPLESVPESSDPIARFAQEYLFEFPLGADTQVPFLLKYPLINEDGTVDETTRSAIIWDEAVMSNLTLNTVDQLFTWTEMLNGTPKRGTMPATTNVDGVDADFTFTPDGETEPPAEETVSTFSTRSSKKSEE